MLYMDNKISDIERRVLAVIQKGISLCQCPYEEMAEKAGIDTEVFLEVLKNWQRDGRIRRIGAVVNHFKVGLGSSAMVVWAVEPQRTGQVGEILAAFDEVSHVYERDFNETWPYNLYTMIHAEDESKIKQIIEQMSHACGIENYRILKTVRELKKVPPIYVIDEI